MHSLTRPGLIGVALVAASAAQALLTVPLTGQVAPTRSVAGYSSRVWTTADGLPINEVWDVVHTRDGYVWLATFAGLVRFDGQRFEVFSSATDPTVPSDRITALDVNADGALIALTEFGHVLRWSDGAFTIMVPDDDPAMRRGVHLTRQPDGEVLLGLDANAGRIVGDSIELLYRERIAEEATVVRRFGDTLWTGTRAGIVYRTGPEGTRSFSLSDMELDMVRGIETGPDGLVYVGSESGLVRFRADETTEVVLEEGVWSMSLSPSGHSLAIGTESGLIVLGGDGVPRERTDPDHPGLGRAVTWDSDETLWHVQDRRIYRDGVFLYETAGMIHDIGFDTQGTAWVASAGLVQLTPAVFTSVRPADSDPIAFYAVAEDTAHGRILLGSIRRGLWSVETVGGTTARPFTDEPSVASLLVEDSTVWIGRWVWGSAECRLEGGPCTEGPLSEVTTRAIHRDPDGSIWFGTSGGLFRQSETGLSRLGVREGLPSDQIFGIRSRGEDELWIATGAGLARIAEGRIETLGTEHGLSGGVVRTLVVDSAGVLWAGTEAQGLNRVELQPRAPVSTARVTHYRAADGLYSDGIHAIVDDGLGRRWMSSNVGVFWVSVDELEAFARGERTRIHSAAYLERDGLPDREGNGGSQSAAMRASDGRLWFAMMGGAAVVDPSDLNPGRTPATIDIQRVVNGSESLDRTPYVRVEPENRDLQIDFTAPSPSAAENLVFRYRMVGFDPDWVEVGPRRSAFYTNLPPGHFTFTVSVASEDGIWHDAPVGLPIIVRARIHEQPWFLPLIAFTLLGGAVLTLQRRETAHQRRSARLEGLVTERTDLLKREKEASDLARRQAESAETEAREALTIVAAQAERLKALDRAKSRFFANISHELRTPLTLTIGPLEDLRDGLHGQIEGEAGEGIELALRNSQRLLRMVNQILDAAKLEAGQVELRTIPVHLNELVGTVAEAFEPLAERKDIRFSIDGAQTPVPAIADPDVVEKVVLNLLSNAFKFTPAGGKISISLVTTSVESESPAGHTEGSTAIIEVVDSGPGISQRDIALIFQRFQQGETRNPTDQPGTGIGLSLVKELIELHGGSVEVQSELGVGSTFRVSLPLGSPTAVADTAGEAADDRTADAEAALGRPVDVRDGAGNSGPHGDPDHAAVPDPSTTGQDDAHRGSAEDDPATDPRTTILLVEDNAEVRSYVRRHLEGEYRVVEAGDGRAGLELAREIVPDLVLSDVMMPEMDGEDLCRAIKSDPELEFVPVVLLTGRASERSRIEALELGADAYMVKPFNRRELTARISNLIDARMRLRERLRAASIVSAGTETEATSPDERFLANVRRIVREGLGDETFAVEELAGHLGVSRAHLYRRMSQLHAPSPAELIRSMRLGRAAELLSAREGTVSEVAYAVGYRSVSHFSAAFRSAYGHSPSAHAEAVQAPHS